jgi:uncharacterized protein YjdB
MQNETFFVNCYVLHYIGSRMTKHSLFLILLLVLSFLRIPSTWAGTAHLSWNPNADSDLAGYIVYYGISSKSYDQAVDVGKLTSHDVTELLDGVTYYFALKAYDTSGNESAFSEEVPFVPGDLPVIIGPVAGIVVSPSSATIAAGANQQFAAVAKDAQGIQIPDAIFTWNSSDSGVAVINSTGLATSIKAGTTTITASSGGIVSNQASLQATATAPPPAPVLTAIEVSPFSITMEGGKTWPFSATAKDSTGSPIADVIFTWSSSNTGVATVSGSGLATAVSPGTALITASSEGVVSNQAMIQVAAVPQQVTSSGSQTALIIEVSPTAAALPVMDNIQFTAVAKNAEGDQVGGVNFIWNSSNPAVAEVDNTGQVTGFSVGTSEIRASGEGVNSNQALLQVAEVTDEDLSGEGPVVAAIQITPPSVMVSKNTTQQFAAVAKDPGGAQISKPSLTWSSSNPNVAVVDQDGVATAVSSGTATITASSKFVISNIGILMVRKAQSSTASGGGCGFVKMRGGRPPDMRQIAVNLLILFAPLMVVSAYRWIKTEQKMEAFALWNGLKLATVSLGVFMVAVMTEEVFTVMSSAI